MARGKPGRTDDPVLQVADAVGGLIQFWGFKRNMGRVWTVLYLSSSPLSAVDLQDSLSMSTGAVSMTVNELLNWGVIRKTWVPGERRDFFEAETSIWKMVSRVFRERELRQIHTAIDVFQKAIAVLSRRRDASASVDERSQLQFKLGRIEGLLVLAKIGEGLLGAILSGKSVDASPLISFTEQLRRLDSGPESDGAPGRVRQRDNGRGENGKDDQ